MRFADFVLRLLLRRRDRDTISGDLLEEYRDAVRPARGPLAARLWYLRQVASFVSPLAWGVAIGIVAGAANLIDTAVEPLSDEAIGPTLVGLAVLLLVWMLITFAAARRTRRFRDALIAGVLVGLATMAVFHVAGIVRVNVFLEQIRYRDDWQNLIARFHSSGSHDLRAYATYEYLRMTPLLLALGALAGAASGVVGGALSHLSDSDSSV